MTFIENNKTYINQISNNLPDISNPISEKNAKIQILLIVKDHAPEKEQYLNKIKKMGIETSMALDNKINGVKPIAKAPEIPESKQQSGRGGMRERFLKRVADENIKKHFAKTNKWKVTLVFANWCGHCKRFMPKWEEISTKFSGKVHFDKIDGDSNKDVAPNGFPTLYFTSPSGELFEYKGNRDGELMDVIEEIN